MLFLITWNYALNSYGVLVDNLLGACVLPEGQMVFAIFVNPNPNLGIGWERGTRWAPTGERVSGWTC